ncbi:MAG: Gfo/Idh/MocA family oxidoreductase [bacterium]|nr:Gfo/Idh/MocA family oxidoreductase [bacterium]
MLKIGIIGTGTMGRLHAQSYSRIPGTKLIGFADPILESCIRLAEQYDAKATSNPDELINNPELDVIDICTPTPFHKEYVLKAAKAKKHIFCEKPIARNLPDAMEMVKAVKSAGVKFMVGHVLHFFPEFVTMKQLIDHGKIGKPGVVRTSRTGRFPRASNDWYANIPMSGGVVLDMIIHDFDWLNWCFGEPKRVFARGLVYDGLDHLDYALVVIRYKNGVIAHVEGSWAQPDTFNVKVEITGSKGQIDFVMSDSMPVNIMVRKSDKGTVGVAVPESPLTDDPYTAEIRHFIDCVVNDKEPAITTKDAIGALRVSLAALESIKTGKPIDLS